MTRINFMALLLGFWMPPILRLLTGYEPRPLSAFTLTGIALAALAVYKLAGQR